MNQLPCPVCSETLSVRIATGRKSGKAFLMLVCPKDGRHIRAFVSDREFVAGVIGRVGGPLGAQSVEEGPKARTGPGDDQEGAGVSP